MNAANPPTSADRLAPLLPAAEDLGTALDTETIGRLDTSWRELAQLGFEVQVNADELRVRHPAQGFESTIQLSRPADLEELRKLFAALRRHFGSARERALPCLFLPGAAVTAPYEHLRTLIVTCQGLRQERP